MPSYPWPASGITVSDMRLLFHARKQSQPRVPINLLIAHAIRQTFTPESPIKPAPAPSDHQEQT